jgi:hypothetical protein
LKRWGDDNEVFLQMAEVSDADSRLLHSVDEHDQSKSYQSWLPYEVTLKEAKLYAGEVADLVSSKLNQDHQINLRTGELNRNEEAVLGAFYLACLIHLPERRIHQGTAVLELRDKLAEDIAEGAHLVRAEQYILFVEDPGRDAITSWAASHLEGKTFRSSEKHSHVPRNVMRFEKVADEALDFASEIEVRVLS